MNYIDPSVRAHPSAKVWDFSVILADVTLGPDVNIGSRCEVGRGSEIGAGTRIGSGTFLPPNSRIGRNVFIGPNVTFTDDRHPRVGNTHYEAEPPVVGDDAAIGAGCVILPGVVIGNGAMVGAGSVVSRDVPPGEKVRGEPARPRGPYLSNP